MRNLREERLYKIFTTKTGNSFQITGYLSSNRVEITFTCGNKKIVCWKHIQSGLIKYPNHRSNCGRGFIGFGEHNSVKSKDAYVKWDKMLTRCYRDIGQGYENCEVAEDWYNFQNFSQWFYSQPDFNRKDVNGKVYCLDKDILGCGKIYSETTCCLVPESLNKVLTGTVNARGYFQRGNCYSVKTIDSGTVGSFNSPELATKVYKETKRKDILTSAKREDFNDDRIITALLDKFIN